MTEITSRRKHIKNTESFEQHVPPDMHVIVENGGDKYPRVHRTKYIVVNNLSVKKMI